jgi:hypothetical protein
MRRIILPLCLLVLLSGCSCFTSTPDASCGAYARALSGGVEVNRSNPVYTPPPPPPPQPGPVRTICNRVGDTVYCNSY